MKIKIISVLICFVLSAGVQAKDTDRYEIIPQPQQIEYIPEIFHFPKVTEIYFEDILSSEIPNFTRLLEHDFRLKTKRSTDKVRASIVVKQDTSLRSVIPANSETAYRLRIREKRIEIDAVDRRGCFYAIQSLRQIIKQNARNKYYIQGGEVTDYPAFPWRAFMLDEARHFKGKEVVCDILDNMSLLKMNTFHWHLTDDQGWRIEIKKYPLLTRIGAKRDSTEINKYNSNIFDPKPHAGYYSQSDIREIVEYAKERHITIVPEIEMPGHASAAIAAYPWLGVKNENITVPCTFGVHYNLFNVADPRVLSFFEDIIDEVKSMFPSEVIHIGGDEVRYNHWNESDEIQAYMERNGIKTSAELQVFFTNKMSEMISSKGRRMMGWNEITGDKLHHFQEGGDTRIDKKLSPNAIIHFWKGNTELMIKSALEGYDLVNSTHDYTYLDYSYDQISLERAYGFSPVPANFPEEVRMQIKGFGCQMWSEFIPLVSQMKRQVYPRLIAYAECGWTEESQKDYEDFLIRLDYFNNKIKLIY